MTIPERLAFHRGGGDSQKGFPCIYTSLFNTVFSLYETGTPRKARPKSLAISTPTKLLSLEEARERAMTSAATSQKAQKYIEVGGGPSNLPATYHTIIDHPHK